jgi:hypothetical protein
MLLLFGGFEFMNVVSHVMTLSMRSDELSLLNNIFVTLFISVLYMLLSDMLINAVREKKAGRIALSLSCMALPLAAGVAPLVMGENMPVWLRIAMIIYVPNLLTVEGGFLLVLMGVLFHVFRGRLLAQAMIPVIFGLLCVYTSDSAQYIMATAAIPILAYNGKKGPGGAFGKYFFYVFYPAHIYLFYAIAWRMSH